MTNKKESPDNLINSAITVVHPLNHSLRQVLKFWQAIKPYGLRGKESQCGKASATTGNVILIINQLNPNDTDIHIDRVLHKSKGSRQRIFEQTCIRIEKQNKFALRQCRPLVTSGTKASIIGITNNL
ncbi:hypothetical protein CARN8_4200001 [mine drainage metagenome]|uniref:Uncharacterized protein n=1 Tax=mine drainage metagenome TaxID=410659 RepID=A0A3P3ZPN3_9ZZZZ